MASGIKTKKILVLQEELFGDIWITPGPPPEPVPSSDLVAAEPV